MKQIDEGPVDETNSKTKEEKELEKESREAQSFKCLVCDRKNKVRWNGEAWECGECGFFYTGNDNRMS